MKRKVFSLIVAGALVFMLGTCTAETQAETACPSVVDYSGSLEEWVYVPEFDDYAHMLLSAIDHCRYGAAGASLSQVDAACKLLQLTTIDHSDSMFSDYFDGMNITQLDYFSFQWQMCMKQAQALLSDPENHFGELEDSGNGNFDLTSYDKEDLAALDKQVMTELKNRNVTDVWKNYLYLEPFIEAATIVVFSDSPQSMIAPLPSAFDLENMENCTISVSLNVGDAYMDDAGNGYMKLTVYDYDLYDMVDISSLKAGNIMLLRGKNVPVTSVERLDTGLVLVNGGIDNGGFDLWSDEDTVYYESGYSDAKAFYELGEVALPVSQNFRFVDSSDLDNEPIECTFENLIDDSADFDYYFTPHNTRIVIESGYVTEMHRVYVP